MRKPIAASIFTFLMATVCVVAMAPTVAARSAPAIGLGASMTPKVFHPRIPEYIDNGRGKLIKTIVAYTPATAGATASSSAGRRPLWLCGCYFIANQTDQGEFDGVPPYGDPYRTLTVNGPGTATLSINRGQSVSNTWSANVGISAGDVTAGMSFNVTATNSIDTTWSDMVSVPSGAEWQIQAFPVFEQWHYLVYWDPVVGGYYQVGSGNAWQFQQGFIFGIYYMRCPC